MLLWAHGNNWGGCLKLSPFGLNVSCVPEQENLTTLRVGQTTQNKQRGATWEQTGIILCTVNHTVVSSGLVHKHRAVMRTLPSHKSYMTTHERDNGHKGLFFSFLRLSDSDSDCLRNAC